MLEKPSALVIPISGIEMLQEGVKGADVEPTQLTPGVITGSLLFANLKSATLSIGQFDGDVRTRGVLSDTLLTFGALLQAESASRLWSSNAFAGDVGVFPKGRSHESVFLKRSMYATLAIPYASVFSAIVQREINIPETLWDCPEIYRASQYLKQGLISKILDVGRLAKYNHRAFEISGVKEAIQDEILDQLISIITQSMPLASNHLIAGHPSHRIVKRAEDYLRAHLDRSVQATELCVELGISLRSLHRAFLSSVDLSPAAYLRIWRLNQVRRNLIAADPEHCTVTQIALKFGFWELGRFAAQYRTHFGELPSVTINREMGNLFSHHITRH